jgi:hypothetical protein
MPERTVQYQGCFVTIKVLHIAVLVLCSDVDIATIQNPFDHLYRDSDVEGMTDGFNPATAYGEIYGIDDASMVSVAAGSSWPAALFTCLVLWHISYLLHLQGWSRYAQGTRHMAFNSGLFFIRSNNKTIDLLTRIAGLDTFY